MRNRELPLSCLRVCGGDRGDDRAAGRAGVRLAIVDEMGKHTLNALEIRDALPGILEPDGGDAADASPVRAILQLEQRFNFAKTETKRLRTLDEADAVDVISAVAPDPAQGSRRLRYQPAPLVVTYRFHAHACGVGDVPDGVAGVRHEHPLDSVPRYGLYTGAT